MAERAALDSFVEQVSRCFQTHRAPDRSVDFSVLSMAEAYHVQDEFIAGRVRDGARVVGWKIGCTSTAIRKQFGLQQAISGKLTEPQIFKSGDALAASSFANCAVEPELVFRLSKNLAADVTEQEVWDALDGVCAGIELHNYKFWYGKPTSQELIASNGIHAGLVLGEIRPMPQYWDLNAEPVSLLVSGKIVATGLCSEIMGGPLRSMKWLAKHVSERGQKLRAGELVIPGSAVELVTVNAGDRIEARFASLPSCFAEIV
jgi:2-keto-4-pentenoate hydratase